MKFGVIITILLQFVSLKVIGQNGDIKFTEIKGIANKPIGKIRNITQDHYGYIWFSGEGERCIYRYDGNRLIAFKHDMTNPNSLGGVSINVIFADDSGLIWIGMGEGMDQFNPSTGTFKHFINQPSDSSSLSSGAVNAIIKDRRGSLWIGTSNGLDRFDEKAGKFIHYRNEAGNSKSLSDNFVWNIYEDRQGIIWVATGFPFFKKNPQGGGLNKLNPNGTFTIYKHDPKDAHSLTSNYVRALYEDSRGNFWVGTSGDGLHTMDRKTGKFERHLYNPLKPDQLSRPQLKKEEFANNNDQVTFIIEDSTGFIWIGSMFSGINRYDTLSKKIMHFEASHGFPDSSAWNAFVAKDGLVWLSTQSDKLYWAGPFLPHLNGVKLGVKVSSIMEDKQGDVWVGTNAIGLLQYDQQLKLVNHYKNNKANQFSFFNDKISSLDQYNQDSIWLGTTEGAVIFNTKAKKFSRFDLGFEVADHVGGVFDIEKDKEGVLWISTGNGIAAYNEKNGDIKRYLPDHSDTGAIGSKRITGFLEDRSGEIWVGCVNGGVSRLIRKTDRFRHYLPQMNGICIFQDKRGTIWAGTSRGLYRYKREEDCFLPFFDYQSDLSIAYVYGITEDDSSNLWIATHTLILKIDSDRKKTTVFGSKFGVVFPAPNAIYKTSKGIILIGHEEGFYAFNPKDLDKFIVPSKVFITDLYINSISVFPGEKSPLKKPTEELEDLVLNYNQNTINFNFTILNFNEPEHVKYYTILEKYDDTWREVIGEKTSYYFNIPPGKYVYKIKAFTSEGEKIEKQISIEILPPWWQRWWAYILYGVVLILAIWSFLKWRTSALNMEKINLEKKVAARTLELKNEKEIVESTLLELKATQAQLIQSEKMASLGELTAGIAHEIQNPLNFVNNFSELNSELIDELEEERKKESRDFDNEDNILKTIRKNEQKINHHGKRAEAIVKGMLEHSRTSSGEKKLSDINALADEYLRLAYHGFRAKDKFFNAGLNSSFDETIGNISVVPQDIGRVLLNLYNNAFYAVNERQKQQGDNYEPTVIVKTKDVNNKIEITVSDNGNGIPQKIVDKIFQPFFTTKPTGEGTGLGLSLSYDIIKAHGGEIRVESTQGEGTVFFIELPV